MRAKRKIRISVNNSLKEFGNEEGGKIQINVKKHKGDKAELSDTIHHEILHAKHPQASEKAIQKKTKIDMSKMTYSEKEKLASKVRMKKINYKIGSIKRKLKVSRQDKVEPGDMINKYSQTKPSRERIAIDGLV